jgi:hypothetical protein
VRGNEGKREKRTRELMCWQPRGHPAISGLLEKFVEGSKPRVLGAFSAFLSSLYHSGARSSCPLCCLSLN